MANIDDNKYSIYSLALNNQGTLLAAGSPENCIRLWDPRTCNKIMKLKGHTHNIRTLIFNKDATQLLSASSDHTVRIWSLAQQMCIAKFEMHTEGVWSVCVNDTFTKCISAGKDLKVFMTDLRDPDLNSVLICEENAPILSVSAPLSRPDARMPCPIRLLSFQDRLRPQSGEHLGRYIKHGHSQLGKFGVVLVVVEVAAKTRPN
jgi:WD40 repeat protein